MFFALNRSIFDFFIFCKPAVSNILILIFIKIAYLKHASSARTPQFILCTGPEQAVPVQIQTI